MDKHPAGRPPENPSQAVRDLPPKARKPKKAAAPKLPYKHPAYFARQRPLEGDDAEMRSEGRTRDLADQQ